MCRERIPVDEYFPVLFCKERSVHLIWYFFLFYTFGRILLQFALCFRSHTTQNLQAQRGHVWVHPWPSLLCVSGHSLSERTCLSASLTLFVLCFRSQTTQDLRTQRGHVWVHPWPCLLCVSGHTLHEIFTLREGMFERIPDLVAWPGEWSLDFQRCLSH